MTVNQARARRALLVSAGLVLAIICLIVSFAQPVRSADVPRIVSVDISGNLHVPTQTIMDVIQVRPGQPYDPAVIQSDLSRINALGYFAAVPAPLIRPRGNGVAITYRVIENPVVTKITFVGNKKVPSDTLAALMDTTVGQVFNTDTFRQDLQKINSYYERIGYQGQLPSHITNLSIDPKTGVVTIDVIEGLTVAKVLLSGTFILPPAKILAAISVKPGVEYSDSMRDKDYEALNKLYAKAGLYIGNFEGGIKQDTINQKAGTADVQYTIDVARVAVVQITGNVRTKDDVIRRQLQLQPGSLLTKDGIKRDYERLNNLGFFSKVEPDVKPGPDPKRPDLVAVVWHVTEQKTAQAQVGVGYQGGITGQGLYGTLGYSDNNLHGTGNNLQLQLQRGSRTYTTQLSASIPYFGKTKKSQRYSVGASIFANGSTYFYPIYQVGNGSGIPSLNPSTSSIPVTLVSTGSQIGGSYATAQSQSTGISLQVGRRLNYFTQLSIGTSLSSIKSSTTVPSPYYFQSAQPNVVVGPTPGPLSNINPTSGATSFGIAATSIANTNTGLPYNLYTVTLGSSTNTLDDYFDPTKGHTINFGETISSPSIGSNFNFTQTQLDATRFFPVLKNSTLGLHFQGRLSTGILPYSALYTFSDQQLRGYNSVFYGTDTGLFQAEIRKPLTADRKFQIAVFFDQGAFRIRGATPLLDPYTNRILSYPGNWNYNYDYGAGLRFSIPQLLGNQVIRLDFAKGANGTHTSFGIGQSF